MGYKSEKKLILGTLSVFMKCRLSVFLVVSIAIIGLSPAVSTAGDNGPCLECHTNLDKLKVAEKAKIEPITGEIKVVSLLIDETIFKTTAHGGEDFFCTDCHQDLDGADLSEGHKPNLKPVDCITFCHDDPADEYLQSSHVKLMKENTKDVPTCKDCHFGLTYRFTPVGEKSPMYVPRGTDPLHRKLTIQSCGSCHQDYLDSYKNNAHGQVTALGHTTTDVPVCFDCHGKHKILNSSEPESKVGKEKILETCGSCHANANASFVKHIEHPQIKNIKYYKTLLTALKNARNDPENLKKVLKNPQTILCIVFVMYIGILGFTFSSFGLHSLLTWFATARDEHKRKGHANEEHH
ncbi:MAG: hypothetical protein DYG83_14715 [Candidatus Brocadia sp. AMX2]|uniref:Cytochrome b subunit of formate dehydrogenase n=1 Tax=Candidatus Brocadia sinica JPN1 TaxID=1197129 RepID=A0ABQ0JZG8_9BACT|nr:MULTISPECIES: hypothetical protein [Brocadia]KXK27879.1 MAG: putative formate dehydrogenase cytochrome b subunit [Candidatus Brocadia sinica]MBC6933696.1 hypothetical protein [Candidatus Brocadia sp.]MBL1170487.1 hypothetical protein [Candidatus Brocadia sp. AMX1]NOG40048.1 hypothetical protein [Planctomycetota bacterium]KAA0243093.1 MAG: hypothetical protein EDM70_11760 [Candidatus Brocadia sp. AMX2]